MTKEQLGKGYFNYSYYFSEKNKYDKASAMLEMSRIFCNDKKLIENELKYIAGCTGIGALPPKHSKEQLLEIMRFENIPAGPSELVTIPRIILQSTATSSLITRWRNIIMKPSGS